MNDMKLIVKLISLIRNAEKTGKFYPAYFSPEALGCSKTEIDSMAIKLQDEGIVEGLITTEDIDNATLTVLWGVSHPTVTIKGITFAAENSAYNKAVDALKETAASGAKAAIQSLLFGA